MSVVAQTEIEFKVSSQSSDGSPTACPDGQIRDSSGYCVRDTNPTPCQEGYERDRTGLCVPVTGANAKGKLTRINRPSTVNAGQEFTISNYFENIGSGSARFSIHVKIPSFLGLDTLTRFIKVEPKGTGVLEIILRAPKMTSQGSVEVKGLIELVRGIPSASNLSNLVIDHSVNISFSVVNFEGVTIISP